MIKQLRIKFICVLMATAAVLVGTILGVVIHFTGSIMEVQSVAMMRTVSGKPRPKGEVGTPADEVRLPFFTVRLDRQGKWLAVDGGYPDMPDREQLEEIVNTALDSGKETGILREYQLRYLKASAPDGWRLVFSDTTAETSTLRNLLYTCLLIFDMAMALFLCVSVLLSRWAIRPVAKAWDQQRQFVADASHELKTPLTVILATAELLQSEDSAEERKQFASRILSMCYQMRSLVDNMLEMARVDNGAVRMQFSAVDFSQLVSDAVLSFQLLYEEQKMGLESTVPEGIHLQGSEHHLYQVLDVLLDNALKYSTPQGEVRITLAQSGRSCLLSVSGPGEPISGEDQKNIFKRFYRADKARAMNGSYGLGLSIAEAVVSAHRGKIWVQSAQGRNTFFVQLPVS